MGNTITHTVEKGESLLTLTQDYGMTADEIRKANPHIVCGKKADEYGQCVDADGFKRDNAGNYIYAGETLTLHDVLGGYGSTAHAVPAVEEFTPSAPRHSAPVARKRERDCRYVTEIDYETKTVRDTERRFVTEYDCGYRNGFNYLKGKYELGYKCGMVSRFKDVPVTRNERVRVAKRVYKCD